MTAQPRRPCRWAAPLLVAAACAGPVDPGSTADPVVYGSDDRQDVFAFADQSWASQVAGFTVALMRPSAIDASDPNDIQFNAGTLASTFSVCPDERFADQRTAAFCSGTLIAPDLVLTAGHCVPGPSQCANTRVVFDYYMTDASTLQTVTAADVFSCSQLVVQELSGALDYAILRLDVPATGRVPAQVMTTPDAVSIGTDLVVHGCPSGLPVKIDDGGAVRDGRPGTLDFFVANLDTFGGNSGSGVFVDQTDLLAGILVRGEQDYVFDANSGCNRVNECPNAGCSGEESTYAFRAIDDLCTTAPEPSLCGCGDGTCAGGETTVTCPTDCGSSCGDGACNGAEDPIACPADCGQCGDAVCDPSEDAGSCCTDCGCAGGEVCAANQCIPDPSVGDTCADPIPIAAVGSQTFSNDTSTALDDYAGSCATRTAPDRVYEFAVTEDTVVEAIATGFDTLLYLRASCADPATEIACNDDATPPGGLGSRLVETLGPGTYFLFVDGFSSHAGPYTLELSFSPAPCPDADTDGTCDVDDGCPADPDKTEPGACGCGVDDSDTDGDGTADCNDLCTDDPDKIEPGACGCGEAEGSCAPSDGGCAAGGSSSAPWAAMIALVAIVFGRRRRPESSTA